MPPPPPPRLTLEGPGRCQFAFTAPFAVLGGAVLGVQIADRFGAPLPVCVVASVAGVVSLVAIQIALEPGLVALFGGREGRWGTLVSYLWDMLMGTVLGLPLVMLVGDPSLPGIGVALTAGAAYGYVMGFVVCGDGPEALVRLVLEGSGGVRHSGHSYAQALAAQGRIREALETYRQAMAADPRDAEPYFGVASLQFRYLHDPEGAILTLRSALREADLSEGHVIVAFQRMAAIRASQNRPQALAPDLARYIDQHPSGGPALAWARENLARVKREMGAEHAPGDAGAPAGGRGPSDP